MIRRKPKVDPVTPEVRETVLRRDKWCFLFRVDGPTHICRDRWGYPHASGDTFYLSLDHVKRHPRLGKRAPSRPEFMVAMCHGSNVGVPSKAVREAERSYLAALYPAEWA